MADQGNCDHQELTSTVVGGFTCNLRRQYPVFVRAIHLLRCPTPRGRARGACGYLPSPTGLLWNPPQASPRSPSSRAWSFWTCMEPMTTRDRSGTRAIAPDCAAFRFNDKSAFRLQLFGAGYPAHPYPVYASSDTSRCRVQNSGPSGSLGLPREALSSFTPRRFIPALR
jgi:hypothetical protein